MKIAQLLEFTSEDFKTMSRQASGQTVNPMTKKAYRQQQVAANQSANRMARIDQLKNPQAGATADPQVQAQQVAGPTGDPTLDQPLPGQEAPKKTIAQRVGGLAKGVGAVAGGVAGIGRAIKKGYHAGADAVGGPGYAQPAAAAGGGGLSGGAPDRGGVAGFGGGSDEISDLRARLQAMDNRLRRIGAE